MIWGKWQKPLFFFIWRGHTNWAKLMCKSFWNFIVLYAWKNKDWIFNTVYWILRNLFLKKYEQCCDSWIGNRLFFYMTKINFNHRNSLFLVLFSILLEFSFARTIRRNELVFRRSYILILASFINLELKAFIKILLSKYLILKGGARNFFPTRRTKGQKGSLGHKNRWIVEKKGEKMKRVFWTKVRDHSIKEVFSDEDFFTKGVRINFWKENKYRTFFSE